MVFTSTNFMMFS